MTIYSNRINKVLGEKPRSNEWVARERYRALETVHRDPTPTRAIMGYIMTAVAVGAAMTIGIEVAFQIAVQLLQVSAAIASI